MKTIATAVITIVLLSAVHSLPTMAQNAAEPKSAEENEDGSIWGTAEQGWESLTEFELIPDSVVIRLSDDALSLTEPEYAELLSAITELGPRPSRDEDREGFFAWNTALEDGVLATKFQAGDADFWYVVFLQVRRLRLYEAAGYEVIDMESVFYSNIGFQFYFLLSRTT